MNKQELEVKLEKITKAVTNTEFLYHQLLGQKALLEELVKEETEASKDVVPEKETDVEA